MSSMNGLAQLQQAWLTHVFDAEQSAVLAYIARHSRLTADQQLNIYRGNWQLGVGKNLAMIFPVCQRLVGCDFFDMLTRAYLAAHPTQHYDISYSGAQFAAFLATFPATQSVSYLTDIARLEWAYHCAYEGEEAELLDVEALAQAVTETPEKVTFSQQNNTFWIMSEYPIVAIWQANQPEVVDVPEIDLNTGPNYMLVWRPQDQVNLVQLTPTQWQFQQGLASGQTFAMMVDTWEGDEAELITVLSEFVQQGWVK